MEQGRPLIIVRGAGDIATGTIHKLCRSGFDVLALEMKAPSAIRRKVAFSEAVYDGKAKVENMTCYLAAELKAAFAIMKKGNPALLVDPKAAVLSEVKPWALVDAMIAKRNCGTTRAMAEKTIALGPGFCAGEDVDLVIETMRGHNLGRIIEKGAAQANTGIPGSILNISKERVIHAPAAGILAGVCEIGSRVHKGQLIAQIKTNSGDIPVRASISGLLRGMIHDSYPVVEGLKIADIDPREDEDKNCFLISDKARCIAGSVLEGMLYLAQKKGCSKHEV